MSYERSTVRFSPSQADNCLRELYFINTNAPQDEAQAIPWQERRRRNGDAYHRETQEYHRQMTERLREAGLPVYFELIDTEVEGQATYRVGDYVVHVVGRADVIARYVGESIPGVIETGDVVIVDYKAKSKLSSVKGIKSRGVPSYNQAQMNAYSLLRFTTSDGEQFEDIRLAILHYESLEKMKETETESKDLAAVVIRTTDEDQSRLLVRWAKVVEAIETGVIPPGEFDKCAFCNFKNICAEVEKGAK